MSRRLIVNISLLSLVVLGLMACIRTPEQIARDYIATQIAGPQGTAEAWIATAQAGGAGDYAATAVSIYQTLVPPEPTGHPLHPSITPSATPTVTPMATATPTVVPPPWPHVDPNLSIVSVEPVQVVEGAPLILNKATAIKVVVRKQGEQELSNVKVRVTEDGIDYDEFFVYEDGNLGASKTPRLLASNINMYDEVAPYPLTFGSGSSDKVVYFFNDGFTPESPGSNYFVEAHVEMGDEDKLLYVEPDLSDNYEKSKNFEVVNTVWHEGPNNTGPGFVIYVTFLDLEGSDFPSQEPWERYCEDLYQHILAMLPISPEKLEIRCNPNKINLVSLEEYDYNNISFGQAMRTLLLKEKPDQTDIDTLVFIVPSEGWRHWSEIWDEYEEFGEPNGLVINRGDDETFIRAEMAKTWHISVHELGHTLGLGHPNPNNCETSNASNGIFVDQKRVIDLVSGFRLCEYMTSGILLNWTDLENYSHILRDHIE